MEILCRHEGLEENKNGQAEETCEQKTEREGNGEPHAGRIRALAQGSETGGAVAVGVSVDLLEKSEDVNMAGVCQAATGREIDFYSLKNTFAMLLFEAEVNVKEGTAQARHTSLNTYARTQADRLAEVVEKVGKP